MNVRSLVRKRLANARPSPALVISVLALVVATAGVTFASIPGARKIIHACYAREAGALRVIDSSETCGPREAPLNWSQGGTNSVRSADIVNGQVKSSDLASGAVITAKLGDGAVISSTVRDESLTAQDLAKASVGSQELASGSVGSPELAPLSVLGSRLADAAVTTPKLKNMSVTTAKLADGAVNSAQLAPNSVTGSKVKDDSLGPQDYNIGVTRVGIGVSSMNNKSPKTRTISCPAGYTVTGGGGLVEGSNQVAMVTNGPLNLVQWRVKAVQTSAFADAWRLEGWAMCLRH